MSASVSGDKKKFTIAGLASHCFFPSYMIGIHSVSVLFLLPPLLPAFHHSSFCTVTERYLQDRWLTPKNTRVHQKLKPLASGGKVTLTSNPLKFTGALPLS